MHSNKYCREAAKLRPQFTIHNLFFMPLIELKDLCKDYLLPSGLYPVLKHVNVAINEGEFIALMGPSGSGKSTLMNIVGCLDNPSSGHYLLDGQDVGFRK